MHDDSVSQLVNSVSYAAHHSKEARVKRPHSNFLGRFLNIQFAIKNRSIDLVFIRA